MEESLEDRLKSHAQAFDGLLSLIPAKYYYEDDKSEQWQKKKQTKEQAKAAKLAKLNPDNARSARDLLDEREAKSVGSGKRKRDDDVESGDDDLANEQTPGINKEKPMEGLKRKKAKKELAASLATASDKPTSNKEEEATLKLDKVEDKVDRKQIKAERKKQKLKEKTEARQAKTNTQKDTSVKQKKSENHHESDGSDGDGEVAEIDVVDLAEPSIASPASKAPSPSFDLPSNISGTSSISSIATQTALSAKPPKIEKPVPKPPVVSQEELRERLQARIAELRHARKADGDEDRPARSRTELIEQRRKKAEQKKALKKALRAQARDEERRKRNEALARGSPLMTPTGTMSPAQVSSPLSETSNFSFSRVAFDNGQFMSADLSSVLNPHKKNTSTVSKTALDALEKRDDRLSNMTPEQRASAGEKDMWLNARKRAQGQRIKDDTSLLKKALKRKDNSKKKSTKEWDDRIAGVANAQAAKQKRREDNLAKRKDDRSKKGIKSKKPSGTGKKKTKARPGFEGSFRAGGSKRR